MQQEKEMVSKIRISFYLDNKTASNIISNKLLHPLPQMLYFPCYVDAVISFWQPEVAPPYM